MKKIIIVGSILVALFGAVLGVVFLVLKILAWSGQPIELKDKLSDHYFDVSLFVQNRTNHTVSINGFEFKPNDSIELRTLSNTLFIRWNGVSQYGKPIEPIDSLKLENSIYGKYSIALSATDWSRLVNAPIADICNQYAIDFLNPMPDQGLYFALRDESTANLTQESYYSETKNNGVYDFVLQESFRRYSSRGSNFSFRYGCRTSGISDRIGYFFKIVDQLTN